MTPCRLVGVNYRKKGMDHAHVGKNTDFCEIVNGTFTGCKEINFRSNYRTMELADLVKRIERRLLALGTNAHAASSGAKKRDAIRNFQRAVAKGKPYSPTVKTVLALASALETTPEWLLFEIGEESPESAKKSPIAEQARRARSRQNNPRMPVKSHAEVATLLDRLTPEQLTMVAASIEMAFPRE